MSNDTTFTHAAASWIPGTPIPRPETIPFSFYENNREVLPEELELDDVELIWWTASAVNSMGQLREAIQMVIDRQSDWGDFRYHPVADKDGNGRYPQKLVLLVLDLLPFGVAQVVESDAAYDDGELLEVAGSIIVQVDVWHQITFELLTLCPREHLPEDLMKRASGAAQEV